MTRAEFRSSIKRLRLTQGAFAAHAGVDPTTVYHWNDTDRPIPRWVPMLLAAWNENERLRAQAAE